MYNGKRIFIILILSLLFATGISALTAFGNTYDKTKYINTSLLTAEGDFDKVKLTDRHFGVWNGIEVEGNLLSVLLTNDDNAKISIDHYDVLGSRYIEGVTYFFYLYVYQGNDNVKEELAIKAGLDETFTFLNVIITISLDCETQVIHYDGWEYFPFVTFIYFIVIGVILIYLFWEISL